MGQLNRQRHQLRRFVTSKTKHQPLIAGATSINSHRDVRRLAVEGGQDATGLRIETELGAGVANFANRFARDSREVNASGSGDFSGNDYEAGGHESFAG